MVLISLVILNIIIAVLIKIYCQLTCGICKCSNHMVGKVVIVTGSNTGIGYETAKNLAERGAKVILACRNESRGISARNKIIEATGNENVYYRELDLASLKSITNFAADFTKNEKRLDVLINNASICESEKVKTEDGLLLAMQTNYFGPFLLTCLLLPLLKSSAPSRIINVSSLAYKGGQIDLGDLNLDRISKSDYNFFQVYRNSKLCNILMTIELARRLKDAKVTANSLHPGVVKTDLMTNLNGSLFKWFIPIIKSFCKSPWEGAQTSIYLAVSPEVKNVSGLYFSDCRKRRVTDIAQDQEVARKLWEISERLVKLK